jgi:hypothetical protein
MAYSPLSMARRHVLGDLYERCDAISETVPVYLNENEPDHVGEVVPELVGHADESHGHYADAFTFHISDELCKRLSAGHFTYELQYELAPAATKGSHRRVCISSISLIARQNYKKPIPRAARVRTT